MFSTRWLRRLGWLFLLLLLAACRPAGETELANLDTSGQVIIWRPRESEINEQTWQDIFNRFEEIYPEVAIIQSVFDADEIRERYELATDIGLGPDLFIANGEWITDLAGAGLLRPVDEEQINLDTYLSGAVQSMRYEGSLYGLPLSLKNNAMYYNPSLVEVPATTLDELLQQALQGQPAAITSTFDEGYWGIQAFGGRTFDENNNLVLTEGGMANWLNWLQNAQDDPGMFINADKLALRQLFIEGQAAYYIGDPTELSSLQEAMGEENVSVAPLPAGPQGAAGPLHDVEAILFSPNSSTDQAERALLLARFLTNIEQETTFMRVTGRVPANSRVPVDNRIYPALSSFFVQARTAVALPNIPLAADLRNVGDDMYRTVLSGVTEPANAVLALNNQLTGETQVAEATATTPPVECAAAGELTVWHHLPAPASEAFAGAAAMFSDNCPEVTLTIAERTREEIYTALESGPAAGDLPDIVLLSQIRLADLVESGRVLPLTAGVTEENRQRFVSRAFNAFIYENEVYGVPFLLEVATLYRNLELAPDAPSTLEDLLLQANSETPLILPVTARDTFWGITAFTEQILDEEGRFLPDPAGLIAWLNWLQENQGRPGVFVGNNYDEWLEQFADGGAAFFAGRSLSYAPLIENLSAANLRPGLLPAGTQGPGQPLLFVESFVFTPAVEEEIDAALAFVDYMTSSEVQAMLMNEAQFIPANINVSTEEVPGMAILQDQVQNAVLFPPGFPYGFLEAELNRLYEQVLSGEQDPAAAACAFVLTMNQELGFSLTLEDLGPACMEEE